MSKSLLKGYPKVIWDGMADFSWQNRKSTEMAVVMNPTYCCEMVEYDADWYSEIKYASDLTWRLKQNYLKPNFLSRQPFGKQTIKDVTFAMLGGMFLS